VRSQSGPKNTCKNCSQSRVGRQGFKCFLDCGQRTDAYPSALSVAVIRSPPKSVYPIPHMMPDTRVARKSLAPSNQRNKIRNPNLEIRNKLAVQINPKSEKSKTRIEGNLFGIYIFWSFEIVLNFGFRASNFLFFAPLRRCLGHAWRLCARYSEFYLGSAATHALN
jgi:hypothetical protein